MLSPALCLRKDSHLVTYKSGGNKTAVDMILIKREHKKRIMNTKVIPGEECVHGQHLVVMNMHLKDRKYRKNHQGLHKVQPRIKVWIKMMWFLCHTLPIFTRLGWCPIVSWDFAGAVSIFGPDALPVIHQ